MSKKNISSQEKVGTKLHVTFTTDQGDRTYIYGASAAKQILKGKDPANYSGKLIDSKKD